MVIIEKSSDFVVTARKWRPLRFKDVVGQDHITMTLKNAIRQNRIHHAYLFSGPRGVGKTTTARILARAVNCTNPIEFEPCNECESCLSILKGNSMDVIEIDGASNNSVEDIRKLRESARYAPSGKYKMYIIDEVHMLSTAAFNALLKTLEEPPPHLLFVFATTEQHKVPATILSRCQRFSFRRMEMNLIIQQLGYIASKEDIKIDEESLVTIAKKADGSMRDAQSLFDQVTAFCGSDIKYTEMAEALHLIDYDLFFRISEAVANHDIADILKITREISAKGFDLMECIQGILEHFRNILTVKVTGKTYLIETSSNFLEKYELEAKKFSKEDILRLLSIISTTEQNLRYASQPKIRFETALTQMAAMDSSLQISELIEEIRSLKKKSNLRLTKDSENTYTENHKNSEEDGRIRNILLDNDIIKTKSELIPIDDKTSKETRQSVISSIINSEDKAEEDNKSITNRSILADELKNGWNVFLSVFANSETGLYMLRQANLQTEFYSNSIILKIRETAAFNMIKDLRKNIEQFARDFFKANISVQIIQEDNITIANEADDLESQSTSQINIADDNKEFEGNTSNNKQEINDKDLDNLHPVERRIVELFGAREVRKAK